MDKQITLSMVVPFYNEEDNVSDFFDRIIPILDDLNLSYELICINDGSSDDTLIRLLGQQKKYQQIKIIDFSRNFGKEAAITAGLDLATGQAVIPIDSDLQDPPELIVEMIEEWKKGYEVVLACRTDRKSDSLAKRLTSSCFYSAQKAMSNIPIPENVGDFRLMDRVVVDTLKKLPERQRFMKGLFAWVGYKQTIIYYKRPERNAGKTKWNYWKLWNFALDGFTSFSTVPLRVWSYIGIAVSTLSFAYGAYILFRTLLFGVEVPGYASLMIVVLFIGGIQLLSLGIIGEYVGRIVAEVKHRPIYVIRQIHESHDKSSNDETQV